MVWRVDRGVGWGCWDYPEAVGRLWRGFGSGEVVSLGLINCLIDQM